MGREYLFLFFFSLFLFWRHDGTSEARQEGPRTNIIQQQRQRQR